MTLPRFHLFEFEDKPWLPDIVRDLATDYLSLFNQLWGCIGRLSLYWRTLCGLPGRARLWTFAREAAAPPYLAGVASSPDHALFNHAPSSRSGSKRLSGPSG